MQLGIRTTHVRMLNHSGMRKLKRPRKIWEAFNCYLMSRVRDVKIRQSITPKRLRILRLANLNGNFVTKVMIQFSMWDRAIDFGPQI